MSIRNQRSWDKIWEKLQQIVGFGGVESPFRNQNVEIDEPTTLYVETTGNDGNPGTQDRPYATVQAAFDYLAKFKINAEVYIKVGVFLALLEPILKHFLAAQLQPQRNYQ